MAVTLVTQLTRTLMWMACYLPACISLYVFVCMSSQQAIGKSRCAAVHLKQATIGLAQGVFGTAHLYTCTPVVYFGIFKS